MTKPDVTTDTESVCRDVTGMLVLATSIPNRQCLGYINATNPCMFLMFYYIHLLSKVDEYRRD